MTLWYISEEKWPEMQYMNSCQQIGPAWNIKIISQFCWIGNDSDQNGDRMSKNDEKLPYLQ